METSLIDKCVKTSLQDCQSILSVYVERDKYFGCENFRLALFSFIMQDKKDNEQEIV